MMSWQKRFREVCFHAVRTTALLLVLGLSFIGSASVMLYVAMHKPTVRVPYVVGQRLPQAERMARQAGLELEVKTRVTHNVLAPNTVIKQWPRAGMTAKEGQPLRVRISKGPGELGQKHLGR